MCIRDRFWLSGRRIWLRSKPSLSKDSGRPAKITAASASAAAETCLLYTSLTGGNAGGSEIASSEAVAQMLDSMPLRGIVNFGGPAAAGMITPLQIGRAHG